MRYLFLSIFLFLSFFHVQAQREAANWFFGKSGGLNFNSSPPTPQTGALQTIEGSASISDNNGNLLFYTDGVTLYNKNDAPMPNGKDLKGNYSSTQSAMIVPKPGANGIYYVFTVDKPDYYRVPNDPIDGLNYSVVDMSLDGGRGDIIPGKKNIHLITYNPGDAKENEFKCSEKITAVISDDCISYWVVTQFVNRFYSFKVTPDGVETTPVVSTTPNSVPPIINDQDVNITAKGYLKISPDGTKLASAYSSTNLGSPAGGKPGSSSTGGSKSSGKVFLYDFNDSTGKVSNEQLILYNSYPYGVEFSPKSEKLYVTANIYDNNDVLLHSDLYQYDVTSSNIPNSQQLIKQSNNVAGALQLAMDGKIYRAGYPVFSEDFSLLSVINEPDKDGSNCNYEHNKIDISPGKVTLGLPPFIQSLFNNEFEFDNICYGEQTRFRIIDDNDFDSVLWEFGDGSTSTDPEPLHGYVKPGTYTVVLNKFLNGITLDPVCDQITITELPNPSDESITQCDADDDPNDGVTVFNLQSAKADLADDSGSQITFYEDLQTAKNDNLNQNGLPDIYRSKTQNQVIYAKYSVYGSDCYNISKVTLKTTNPVELSPSPAYGCDFGDGKGDFDFEIIAKNIKDELNLDPDMELSFHDSRMDAQLDQNNLPALYSTPPATIYIRANSENICYGFGSMELKLKSVPTISGDYEMVGCKKDFPLVLGNGLNIESPNDYEYTWSTGENSQTIQIDHGGDYSLELKDKKLGCGQTIYYNVTELEGPSITDVVVDNHGANSDLDILTSEDQNNLYSLDNIDGPYQSGSSFDDVPGGTHIVYVKNENSCEIAQKQVLLFGYPDFFTPNSDGYNDTWKPYNVNDPNFVIKNIFIYDRYGKLLVALPPNRGWDGTFNGHDMPSDDYWFSITFTTGREIRGHFTLKRS